MSSCVVLSHSSESVDQLMLNSVQCVGISSSVAPFSKCDFILISAFVAGSVRVLAGHCRWLDFKKIKKISKHQVLSVVFPQFKEQQ